MELNRRLGMALTDSFCGFKAYRVPALADLRITDDGYAMPLELWVQAAALGWKIVELAVPLIYLDASRSFGGALDNADTRLRHYLRSSRSHPGPREHAGLARAAPGGREFAGMNAGSDALAYRRLRAPREPGGVLLEPPHDRWTASLADNRARLARARQQSLAGLPLSALQTAARQLLVDAARTYSAAYRSVPAERVTSATAAPRPLILTGHQPQLFHPGVWFKNFVVAEMASHCDAVGVNLIIDNDTLRAAAVRVPTGSALDPHIASVPLDTATDEIPFEERSIQDTGLFGSFPQRVRDALRTLVADPLVDALWPAALDALRRSDNLGRCLSEARHVCEGGWGLPTYDVPLSVVCDAWPFRWFVVHLLDQGGRFRDVYNQSLAEYRRTHRIRSRSHPVPELARDGDWLEAPFWVWTSETPRRRRLFARRLKDRLELTDRTGWRRRSTCRPTATRPARWNNWRSSGRRAEVAAAGAPHHVVRPPRARRPLRPWHRRSEVRSAHRRLVRAFLPRRAPDVRHGHGDPRFAGRASARDDRRHARNRTAAARARLPSRTLAVGGATEHRVRRATRRGEAALARDRPAARRDSRAIAPWARSTKRCGLSSRRRAASGCGNANCCARRAALRVARVARVLVLSVFPARVAGPTTGTFRAHVLSYPLR